MGSVKQRLVNQARGLFEPRILVDLVDVSHTHFVEKTILVARIPHSVENRLALEIFPSMDFIGRALRVLRRAKQVLDLPFELGSADLVGIDDKDPVVSGLLEREIPLIPEAGPASLDYPA